jgi:streptomycin 6-kinase
VIDVPAVVRAKAAAAGATGWVDDLPALVASLERAWSITVGRTFTDATEAFVAEATCADGSSAVLKILVPRAFAAAHDEMTVLRLCDGDGCARLYAADDARDALLMERLGPSLHDLGRPLGERHEILCALAQRVWRPAPDSGLRTGAQKGRRLAEFIVTKWQQLDRPCSPRAVRHALDCAERRVAAHDDERAVLVHGDIHEWNALRHGDGWKLVDPDGLLAEPEYDLGILMREDPVELLDGDPMDRAHALATRTGCDPVAIWEWGVVERVSTGLLGTEIGMQPVASQMLRAADVIAASIDDR